LSKTIVSDKSEFEVILPDNDRVSQLKVAVYDNTGNIVFEKTQNGANVSWSLTSGRGQIRGERNVSRRRRGEMGKGSICLLCKSRGEEVGV